MKLNFEILTFSAKITHKSQLIWQEKTLFKQDQNSVKFPYLEFLAIFSFLECFTVNGYFATGHICDIIVMSPVEFLFFFWFVWTEDTHYRYTIVLVRHIGVQFSSLQGIGNHTFVSYVAAKAFFLNKV